MPELSITSIQDLEKLKGWTIKEAEFLAPNTGESGFIKFRLHRRGAACEVELRINPVITVRTGLLIRSTDVKEEKK